MTAVRPVLYVEPPVVEPYKFGLFGATQELTLDDPHWQAGGIEWESLGSYPSMEYAMGIFNGSGQAGAGGAKTLPDNIGTTSAWPFAVYAGVDCGSIGRPTAEYEERARAILALSEQHAVEAALWNGAPGNTPHLNQTGVTTLTAAASVRAAVSALEVYMRNHYSGRATLLTTPDVAPFADWERQVRYVSQDATEDAPVVEHLETTIGSRWAFLGGGDGTGPAAVAPVAGKAWIYATGALAIARTDVEVPADFAGAFNRSLNRQHLIAERGYLVGVDGPIVAIQATLS